jgi:membrane protease YdiL (CAAX protease family)
MEKWTFKTASRDFFEIIAILGFVVVIPVCAERIMVAAGLGVTGSNRIIATGIIFVAWALLAALFVAINRESLSEVGLKKPSSVSRTGLYGLFVAAAVFLVVVGLEKLGYGANRIGEMATELKGNPALLAQRIVISVLIVGFVEEFIFRGFLLLRLTKLFGGSNVATATALVMQAAFFGLSHAYQHLYGILLTGFLGLFFGIVYLALNRNLWVVVIGHGLYDAAHALFLAGLFGTTRS